MASADDFLDRLAAHVSSLGDPSEILVEGLCFSIEQLPREAYLGLMLATGRRSAFDLGTTSATAVEFAKALLRRLPIDWQVVGMDDGRIEELVEFMLRLLQSFIIDPGDPPRTGVELRSFIAHWMSPALVPPPSTDMETGVHAGRNDPRRLWRTRKSRRRVALLAARRKLHCLDALAAMQVTRGRRFILVPPSSPAWGAAPRRISRNGFPRGPQARIGRRAAPTTSRQLGENRAIGSWRQAAIRRGPDAQGDCVPREPGFPKGFPNWRRWNPTSRCVRV